MSLSERTVKELRDMARPMGITGVWEMRKHELIDAIIRQQSYNDAKQQIEVKEEDLLPEEKQVIYSESATSWDELEDADWIEPKKSDKSKYVARLQCGSIIAFKTPEGRMLSGKVVQFTFAVGEDAGHMIYCVETKNGKKFTIKDYDIAWVRTGERWPKGIYNALRGITNEQRDR